MKKQLSILVVAVALLLGATACSNDNNESSPVGEGTLKIDFKFETVAPGAGTRAATSDAKPTTAWANLHNMQLVLAQSGVVKAVRPVAIPASGNSQSSAELFDRIPVGTYQVYLIANNGYVGNPLGNLAAKIGTATPIIAGTNLSAALMQLVAAPASSYLGTAPATAYDEASELFIGYHASAVIQEDQTTTGITIALARAVSLLRIRINQTDVVSGANTVDFTIASDASVRLRRHASSLNVATGVAVSQFGAPKENFAFTSTKAFKNAAPGSDYTGNMGLGSDFTLWNDYVTLPGGSVTAGADKFNLLISGRAPAGYINSVGGVVAAGGARVWWQGDVDGLIASNGILVLNVKVATPGYEDPNPPTVDTYGKLEITATIADWAPATNVDVPL